MRDAIGGVVNISFIAVFMIVVSGYLAFSVSYNKAFKVKNKVISILEQYEHVNPTSIAEIQNYMELIGYNPADFEAKNDGRGTCDWNCDRIQGVCYKWVQEEDSIDMGIPKGYFSVKTALDIDIPIFNKFLPFMNFFQTSGDTMTINAQNDCNGE